MGDNKTAKKPEEEKKKKKGRERGGRGSRVLAPEYLRGLRVGWVEGDGSVVDGRDGSPHHHIIFIATLCNFATVINHDMQSL